MKALIIFLVLLSAIACSREVRVSEEDLGTGVFYIDGCYRPFTGKCIVTFAQGKNIAARLNYKHGYLDGEALLLYPSGKVKQKGSFSQGEFSGTWQFWDVNGKKTGEYTYSK
jgi:antitoxin component YwqK of YwqJK toxin-antitoxin module